MKVEKLVKPRANEAGATDVTDAAAVPVAEEIALANPVATAPDVEEAPEMISVWYNTVVASPNDVKVE